MTLIKSISGIRGTIGGGAGVGLNPLEIHISVCHTYSQNVHGKKQQNCSRTRRPYFG